MTYIELQGHTWYFHRDGFIASEQGIDLDTSFGGLKSAFGASSFLVVKCSGQGKAIVATYGALRRVDLQAGPAVHRGLRAHGGLARRHAACRCTRSAA